MTKRWFCARASSFSLALAAVAMASARPASAQSYTWSNVEIAGGGFVPGIIFNPTERGLVYARTDIGGAYRLDTATRRWVPLLDSIGFDDWNLTGVDSLATDPVDPNRVYILAGTYTNEWTSQNGAILRSTDRGRTWQRTSLSFKSGGNMPGRSMGERLVIDPNRNATLYLGARSGNGLWRSTDFGVTWSRVTSFSAVGTYIELPGDVYRGDIVGVAWVVFDGRGGTAGTATRTIYVGVADKGTSIYRSTDAGATWAAVPGQPTGFLPHHAVLGSNGTLYVTYSDGAGPYDGLKGDVWKLNTATGAWTNISPVPSTSADDYFGYGGLAVDAQRPDTLMVASLNSWWPDTILFRSIDAGATWTRIWDWTSYPSRSLRYTQDITAAPWLVFTDLSPVPPVPSPKLGWMVGDVEIDPFNSDRLLYGTGATIYTSENLTRWDAGATIGISVAAQGLEECAVLDLISPPSGAPLLSGLLDLNGFRHDSLTTAPSRMFSTPGFAARSLDFAELSPNFITRAGDVDKAANPSVNRAAFSFDGGSNWFQASSEPGGVTGGGTIAAAANASRVVWAPVGAVPHVSTNNGSSWTASTGAPAGATVAADRVNPLRFYAFSGGTFYASANGGASFTAAATGLPAIARFKAVPGREGDVWLAGGTETGLYGLWHSTDGGATFTKLAGIQEADNIGFGRAAAGQTYPALYTSAQIGGVRGIYRSDDAGATWVRINDDAHQYGSTNGAITGDPRVFGRVYIGTNGRGIIRGEATGPAPANFSVAAAPAAVSLAAGGTGTSTLSVTRTTDFTASVCLTVSGLPTGVTASFNHACTPADTFTLTLTAAATAPSATATITVTGTGGGLTRTTTLSLTVGATSGFTLSASPATLSVNRGASGQSTIAIARTAFPGSVAFTASGLPTGVTAAFNPTSTTGNSATVTLTAAATAALGSASVTITGTSGTTARTATIALTVAAGGGGNGGVTATPAVTASGPWFNEEQVRLDNTASLTALQLTVVVQRTGNVSFAGQYNTVGGQVIAQTSSTTATAITYQFTLQTGQTLAAGTNRTFAIQASGSGTAHPTTGDTYTVTYTTGGQSFTQSGTF